MLRVPFLVALALAIAFAGGVASSFYALRIGEGFDIITIGPWKAWPELQTSRADPYAMAHRARSGDILLGEAEGLIFIATTDSSGRPLLGRCSYAITGQTPAARFWTLRMTDAADRPLPSNEALPSAFQSHAVLRRTDGSFTIVASSEPVAGNWMALSHRGPIRFVLTLLDTPTAGNAGLVSLEMPAIKRRSCAHA
ncbi:MAG: DUF1214 domain-containing protein [Pararhizobium sp.]